MPFGPYLGALGSGIAQGENQGYEQSLDQMSNLVAWKGLQALSQNQQQPMPPMPQGQPPMQPPMGGQPPGMIPPQLGGGGSMPPGGPPMGHPPQGGGMPPPMQRPMGGPPMGPPGDGGAPPQMQQGGGQPPQGQPPPQQQPTGWGPQGMGGGGDMNSLIQSLARSNPGVPPQVLFAAAQKIIKTINPLREQQLQQQMMLGLGRIGANLYGTDTRAGTARDVANIGAESRENVANIGAQSRESVKKLDPRVEAYQKFLEENPNASAKDRAEFIKSETVTGQAATEKKTQAEQGIKATLGEIDTAIKQIEDSSKGGGSVVGMTGKLQRGVEWIGGMTGADTGTESTQFADRIRRIQLGIPRMLAGIGRIGADERKHLDEIVAGLGNFTSPPQALAALQDLKKFIAEKTGVKPDSDSQQPNASQGKPLTDQVKKTIMRLKDQGWAREDIERWMHKNGYDPAGE